MHTNFSLCDCRRLAEYNGEGRLYRHVSGAQVFVLENRDENKVFSIAFRTPPSDDSGLPHILEHTVLAGSQKYPLKEPFNELLKGSLYTYLNAMTYRDHTVYPIASCNARDFMNLADVYLDAVFRPLVGSRPESFWQEGWHDSMPDEDAPLSIGGVVYNEMQGAYSDPHDLVQNALMRALFPDSPLRFDAGGDPAQIPTLTHEALMAAHAKWYHPANAFIYLYGDMDVSACFAMLDGHLSGFEVQQTPLAAPNQAHLPKPAFISDIYASAGGKNVLGAAFVLDDVCAADRVQAWQALAYILFGTEASPLKKALEGLGEDVTGYLSPSTSRAVLEIIVTNADGDATNLQEAVRTEIERLIHGGMDASLVEACLNRLVFRAKEADHGYKPKGLAAHIQMLPCWLNGGDPYAALSPIAALESLYEQAKNGMFEEMLRVGILQNTHSAYVCLCPDETLEARRNAQLQADLQQKKERMTAEERQACVAQTSRLAQYQAMPESADALESLPLVALADIRREAAHVDVAEEMAGGTPMLVAEGEGSGVAYARLMFDVSDAMADLYSLGVLAQVLGKMATSAHSSAALANEINARLGGFAVGFETLRQVDGGFVPYMTIYAKAADARLADLFALAGEVALQTVFDDKSRLRTLLLECKAGLEDGFVTAGHVYACRRAEAAIAASARFVDMAEGVAFYEWLATLLRDYDARAEELCADLRRVSKIVFTHENVRMAVSASGAARRKLAAAAAGFARELPNGSAGGFARKMQGADVPIFDQKEAFITSSRVQYNVLAADMRALGFAYDGGLRVLQNIASQGFLLDELRVKNGAYGCGAAFGRTGLMHLYSYRDPQLGKTYETYEALAAAVSQFAASPREMQKYILGAVSEMDRPPRPGKKAEAAMLRHMAGVTPEAVQLARDAVLSTSVEDIRRKADMLATCVREGSICTFGSEAAIDTAAGRFASVRRLGV